MNRTLEKPVYIYISLSYTSSDRHNDKNVVVAVVVLAGSGPSNHLCLQRHILLKTICFPLFPNPLAVK